MKELFYTETILQVVTLPLF